VVSGDERLVQRMIDLGVAATPCMNPLEEWWATSLLTRFGGHVWAVATIPFDGAGQRRVFPNARTPVRWSRDGTFLTTALTHERGVSNIWAVPLDGSAPHQLTSFDDQAILNLAWSPHGDRLACVRASSGADVVLFRKQK
jgi:dipeptidyl aminopeptidase/acylaminoacyl peptidase